MSTNHTPGPWRQGTYTLGAPTIMRYNGAYIVSATHDTGHDDAPSIASYGGHLICESVTERNMALLLHAPDMFEILYRVSCETEPYSMVLDAEELLTRIRQYGNQP